MFEELSEIVSPIAGEAYYVGGCVRDCLLGRPIKDVDIAVAGDPRQVGEAVARALGGHFFWLRERDGTARVTQERPGAPQVDIVRLAGSIEADLRRRDYTVNAMAIPVAAGLDPGAGVIDPTGGRADLEARRLRLASEEALRADPLRALRGVRLAVQLDFTLEPATVARLREAGPWLERVSEERIRDELFLCLSGRGSAPALRQMAEFGLLACALPELSPILSGAEWEATLEHVAAVETALGIGYWVLGIGNAVAAATAGPNTQHPIPNTHESGLAVAVQRHLDQVLTPPRGRRALLEFGALVWRLPEPEGRRQKAESSPEVAAVEGSAAQEARLPSAFCLPPSGARGAPLRKVRGLASQIGRQLALSAAEAAWLAHLLAARETARAWVQEAPGLGREVYRFWKQAGQAAADALLLAAADPRGGQVTPAFEEVLGRLLEYERGEHPPLLSGADVMAASGLGPGPALGQLLEELAEAQADGRVRSPEEARRWIVEQRRAE